MRLKILSISMVVLVLFTFCSTKQYNTEFSFANKLAKEGLWKEAYFRWNKYLQAGHNTAAVHNNLAVALEQMKRYDEAEKEYKIALDLSPGNSRIEGNYNKFKKLRSKKKGKPGGAKEKDEPAGHMEK